MGGSNRAYDKALIKFAYVIGATDSNTEGLITTATDGTNIVIGDVILGCIEIDSTAAITDRTAVSAIIAGNKITVPSSFLKNIAIWWLSVDGEPVNQQTASPYVKSEIAAGTLANTDMTIAGVNVGDEIISAISIDNTIGSWTDQTSATTITTANTVRCTNVTTGEFVWVFWMDRSGGIAYSALNLQFGVAIIEALPSPAPDQTDATLTGINVADRILVALHLDKVDGDVLDELTSVITVDADDSLRINASFPSPTDVASSIILCFYQKADDLAA